jgi:transposase
MYVLLLKTIEQKLEAVKQIKNGEILRSVAEDFGVGISTVSDWVKLKSKLEHSSKMPNRKTMKTTEYKKLNEALYLWFTQQREKGTRLSGPIIQGKAKMVAKMMEQCKSFTASSDWLDRRKTQYGVRHLNICGEKLSADEGAVNVFKTEFKPMIQGYTSDQIFSADERGLNFKMLPKKIPVWLCRGHGRVFYVNTCTLTGNIFFQRIICMS